MEEYVSSNNKARDKEASQPVHERGEYSPSVINGALGLDEVSSRSLLSDAHLGGRGNSSVRAASMQRMQKTNGNRAVQRFMSQHAGSIATKDIEIAERITAKSGGGHPLNVDARERIEDGLGADLTGVQVHTDGEADQLARSVNSIAFTSGQDIFFSSGAYDPQSSSGLRLLAHEATHTVQQSQGPVDGTPKSGGVSVSDPSDSFEQAAEQSADAVVSGRSAVTQSTQSSGGTNTNTASPSVQRWFGSGDNLENDFWGTKALLGNRAGGTLDAGMSAAWNIAGAIPGAGTLISGVGAGIDVAKAVTSGAMGDNKAARRFANDAEFSALGAIPGYGTVQGVVAGTNDLSVGLYRATGNDPKNEAPLSGDLFNKIPSAFGDPRTIPEEDLPREGSGSDGGVPAFDPDGPNQTPFFPGPLAPELLGVQ